ncbi:MAG TPA: OFA family MFS transporter [Sulfuricurvum sp.]|nr:MAG: MFS transporter [Campylobacterales bacterium 16-40-21]OZA03524.1 MAG: MFS transporter [Sulfuricurvum sp. 17-40-25]HQS65964.1 OFA family MFS transporter [Sulfuricurvum sp.]HQT35796.1 OFA family MFS transporter [Sulfuricurvum sp.]
MNTKIKNRWLVVISAMAIHLCIGSVYAWSVYVNPIQSTMDWTLTDVTITFSVAIFFLGLSAALMGKFVEKKGPRVAATLAAVLFGLGTMGSGLAIALESKILLYLTYGVLGGTGLGIGYISPVSMLVKWFPDRRGMATGLAIMGFGFSSAIFGPTIKILIDSVGVSSTFYILGALFFVVMFSAAQYLANPPQGYMPERFSQAISSGKKKIKVDLVNITRNEAVKTGRFYGLWIMLFINVTCGIAIISVASPLLQEVIGISALAAASAVGLMGIFNGAGRIIWASISDYLTRPVVFIIFFITQIIAFYLLTTVTSILLFQVVLYYIMMCYGGAFSSIPAYIGDIFGTKELGAIHGYILTAWALAGLAGPIIIAYVKDSTGSYTSTLYVFVALFFIALITSVLMLANIKKIKTSQLAA